jgi:dihydroxy-acid dehydratase
MIAIDIPGRTLTLEVSPEELERRRAAWLRSEAAGARSRRTSGVLGRYVKMVSGADKGAVLA